HAKSQLFRSAGGNTVFRALVGNTPAYVYCTWPDHYERDGLNQDMSVDAAEGHVDATGVPKIDEGRNGVDDDADRNSVGVDDPGELEPAPPYPYPLRGIEVTIRFWEVETKQMRQASIAADFIPE